MKSLITIAAAKWIAEKYLQDQVIVIGLQKRGMITTVTTYGITTEDCDQVAQAGNWLKEFLLKWPIGECQSEPNRVMKLRAEIKRLKKEIEKLKK